MKFQLYHYGNYVNLLRSGCVDQQQPSEVQNPRKLILTSAELEKTHSDKCRTLENSFL